jgi:hypothetical protein
MTQPDAHPDDGATPRPGARLPLGPWELRVYGNLAELTQESANAGGGDNLAMDNSMS